MWTAGRAGSAVGTAHRQHITAQSQGVRDPGHEAVTTPPRPQPVCDPREPLAQREPGWSPRGWFAGRSCRPGSDGLSEHSQGPSEGHPPARHTEGVRALCPHRGPRPREALLHRGARCDRGSGTHRAHRRHHRSRRRASVTGLTEPPGSQGYDDVLSPGTWSRAPGNLHTAPPSRVPRACVPLHGAQPRWWQTGGSSVFARKASRRYGDPDGKGLC